MEKKTQPKVYLPHELITQILVRLPVKALIQLKWVSKSWFSLISDPHCANLHFQLTTSTAQTPPRILAIMEDSPHEVYSIDFESSHYYASLVNLTKSCLIPQSHNFPSVEIKGSCRGFIFFHCFSSLYLWNPSTGLHIQIPLSHFDSKLKKYHSNHLYGFGYDHSTDDYLVVSISYHPYDYNDSSHLEFFSLRNNIWKQIEIEGTHLAYMNSTLDPRSKRGVLFNGAIHCLLGGDFQNGTTEIWVMKESCWTKTLVLPPGYFYPIYTTKNNDIIGKNGFHSLVKYNDQGQQFGFHGNWDGPYQAVMYIESLLSLPDNDQV
ncbi:putative F-box domain, galactose oxidase/kelch, beta-propeller, F-box associated interaction [Medicago truncatula]|uniref:Putative F-box domain, galactose oxidase/kelch, beta-propeller, F-box associated interaction n=1 Tax=Medicago truncatula TaxID=3880 RepID=A0A396IFH3_MEDTR|nr:putative F-box domain, galactose oxidase/kelch, beta-propeller, F-box associated interaction [Medicago truncatula]